MEAPLVEPTNARRSKRLQSSDQVGGPCGYFVPLQPCNSEGFLGCIWSRWSMPEILNLSQDLLIMCILYMYIYKYDITTPGSHLQASQQGLATFLFHLNSLSFRVQNFETVCT